MSKHLQVVEINGIKMEIDTRLAKRVDQFRVGDRVKVLKKDQFGKGHKVFSGVIAGFEMFKSLPTIIIAYIEVGYNEAKIQTVYYNSNSEDVEIVVDSSESLPIEKGTVLASIDREIEKKQAEINDLMYKRRYFIEMFGKFIGLDDEITQEEANEAVA